MTVYRKDTDEILENNPEHSCFIVFRDCFFDSAEQGKCCTAVLQLPWDNQHNGYTA